ncbi:MAG TPA: M20/M25/M40 family metallo-hydrolase, partial [bacterium]
VVLEPSEREHGTIRVHSGGSYKIGAEPVSPALVVAAEHYGRLARLLEKNIPVKVEINIQTRFFENDSLGYNVIAEIPGTDKKLKTELVMLGGHLDSWHSGTGATDNAAGCAVTMEAARILNAIGVKPRRTIRIALWGGEEQGLLGSHGYVRNHFGDRHTLALKAEHTRLSAYFNLDNGTGKIRGIYLQENDAVRPVFEAYLAPFHDLGAIGVTIRDTGGTDHLAFDAVGLPGFQFIQDPIDYGTRTHHTNMDVYDHAQPSDLMQASVIMASFVYHTAMRDEKLPRKPLPEPESQNVATNGQ